MSRLVVPILHPASVVRGRWEAEAAQEIYLGRAKSGDWPDVDLDQGPPDSVLFPSLGDLSHFRKLITSGVSVDLENAGRFIICMGLTVLDMDTLEVGASLCLRWRLAKGARYWQYAEHTQAVEWAYDLFADPGVAKVFHNGVTHDVPLLEGHGFEVNGRLLDTMIMMRVAYSEMKSSLQYCGTLWLGMPCWKTMINEEEEDK